MLVPLFDQMLDEQTPPGYGIQVLSETRRGAGNGLLPCVRVGHYCAPSIRKLPARVSESLRTSTSPMYDIEGFTKRGYSNVRPHGA